MHRHGTPQPFCGVFLNLLPQSNSGGQEVTCTAFYVDVIPDIDEALISLARINLPVKRCFVKTAVSCLGLSRSSVVAELIGNLNGGLHIIQIKAYVINVCGPAGCSLTAVAIPTQINAL